MWVDGTYKDTMSGPGQHRISGSFYCNGSSDLSSVKGKGFTVSRTGTGNFKVLLGPSSGRPTPFKALLSCALAYQIADGTVAYLKVNSATTDVTDTTAPNVLITNTNSSGTATDLTDARVFFELLLATDGLNA